MIQIRKSQESSAPPLGCAMQKWGHSSVLHCASLLHTIFGVRNATLMWFLSIALRIPTVYNFRVRTVRANKRLQVHNERNYPQAKLDNWRNKRSFSFKLAWWPNFYRIIIVYILSSLIENKIYKMLLDRKKDLGESVQKHRTLEYKLCPRKQRLCERFNLCLRRFKCCDFPQISYDIVLYARHLLPVRFYSQVLAE